MNIKERANQLKTDIPAVYMALMDRETAPLAKVFAAATIIYALSPIDLIPDFIPVIGYLDDLILLPLLIALTIRFIPKEIMDKHRNKAAELWKDGLPVKWYYTLPVIFLWALIIWLIVKAIWL